MILTLNIILIIAFAGIARSAVAVFAATDVADVVQGSNWWLNVANLGVSTVLAGWVIMKGGPAERAAANELLLKLLASRDAQHAQEKKDKDEAYGKIIGLLADGRWNGLNERLEQVLEEIRKPK